MSWWEFRGFWGILQRSPNAFFFTQTVDKGEVAFEILGHILAYGIAAAFLETVIHTGETVMFEDGGNDIGDGLVLKQAGIAQGLFLLMIPNCTIQRSKPPAQE